MCKMDSKEIVERLHINLEKVPTEYCWSGYTDNIKEFEELNFYRLVDDNRKLLFCSADNIIALCDYVSNRIIKQQFVWDTEDIYSPGCDIWFFYSIEMLLSSIEELPQWIQDIINYLIKLGIIQKYTIGSQELFVLLDTERYLDNAFPEEYTRNIEHICQKGIIEFWNSCLDENDGNIEELLEPECGTWGKNQFELFVENPECTIMACCTSESGHSIGFGTCVSYRELLFQKDMSWIYEGMTESMYENWFEFEDIAKQVEKQALEYYRANHLIPESDDAVNELLYNLLRDSLGDFSIGYQVENTEVEMNCSIDITKDMYDTIIHNFAIDFRILKELKEK